MRNGNPGKGAFAAAALALAAALCLAGGSLALATAGGALAGGGQAAGGVATSTAAGSAGSTLQAASALVVLDDGDESSSDEDDGAANEEGATITDEQGIVYEVTAAATADEAGEAEVSDGSGLSVADATVGEVTQQVDGVTYAYAVTAVASSAFQGNETLESIEFTEDLTGSETASVGTYAFSGCTSLASVDFPAEVSGIGSYAFNGCTALADVSFPEGAELYVTTTNKSNAIDSHAFDGCTSLVSISVPAIVSACRKGDYYFTTDEYNADVRYTYSDSSTYVSGFYEYWHGSEGSVARTGIGDYAFSGCTALQSIVFEAGNPNGAYAYWDGAGAGLSVSDCPALTSVVYECAQAFWGDPNGSIRNQSYTDMWGDNDGQLTLYYAVDFYATDDASEVEDDDCRASGRYARVELANGTATDAIKAGDAEALAGYLADADLYAEDGYADGEVPDPDEVAASLGYDTDVSWAWRLTGSQSQREGLTESCAAYLVEASDLSAGRLHTPVASALQQRCDQNFSRWIFDLDGDGVDEECDSTFDPARWLVGGNQYNFTAELSGFASEFYIVVTSDEEGSFLEALTLHDALGNEVDLSECTLKYRRWSSSGLSTATSKFETALDKLGDDGGPLLVTVTPGEGTGLDASTSLSTWVLVAPNTGSVHESYTDSAASTFTEARAYVNHRSQLSDLSYDAPYAVGVSSADLASAAVAAGVAGMAGAAIEALDEEDEGYGMTLWTGLGSGATIMNSTECTKTYPSASSSSASAYAAAVYQALGSARSALGASEEDYPWGDAAVLACAGDVEGTAAAAAAWAYANAAPVLYAEADGSVSEATLECLEDFGRVVVVADESDLSDEALAALAEQAAGWGASVERVAGDAGSACSLSIAVAEDLIEDGLASPYIACVTDAVDSADAIVALSLSGHEGGVSLLAASTADAKEVCSWLRARRDYVAYVRLFGRGDSRTSSEDFDLYDTLCLLWDEGAWEDPAVAGGDTLALHGASFDVGSDGSSLTYASDLWAHATIAAGTYTRARAVYTLASDAAATNAAAVTGAVASGGSVALSGDAEAIAAWAAAVTCVSVDGAASSEVTVASDGTIAVSALADGGHSVVVYAAGYDPVQLAVTVSSGQATSAALGALEEDDSTEADASTDDASSAGSGSSASKASAKKAQSVKVKAKKAVTVKYSKLKKKAQSVKASKLCKVTGAKGKLTYSKVSVKRNGKRASKKLAKKITVNKAGKVTLKKGLAKGTYKVKLKVKAAATSKYKASKAKTVTVTIKVK